MVGEIKFGKSFVLILSMSRWRNFCPVKNFQLCRNGDIASCNKSTTMRISVASTSISLFLSSPYAVRNCPDFSSVVYEEFFFTTYQIHVVLINHDSHPDIFQPFLDVVHGYLNIHTFGWSCSFIRAILYHCFIYYLQGMDGVFQSVSSLQLQ